MKKLWLLYDDNHSVIGCIVDDDCDMQELIEELDFVSSYGWVYVNDNWHEFIPIQEQNGKQN